jgi:hypothetical protein
VPPPEPQATDGTYGHCANLDRPAEVNTLIGSFLERHAEQPAS